VNADQPVFPIGFVVVGRVCDTLQQVDIEKVEKSKKTESKSLHNVDTLREEGSDELRCP